MGRPSALSRGAGAFFNIHFVIRTLKEDFMPNLSQIDEMKWPTKARKLQTIALKRLFVFVEA